MQNLWLAIWFCIFAGFATGVRLAKRVLSICFSSHMLEQGPIWRSKASSATVLCTRCNTEMERWKGDPSFLNGFFACSPDTWRLGSLCFGDSIAFQWKLCEEWSAQEVEKLRYSTFPCIVETAEEVSSSSASSVFFSFRWATCSDGPFSKSREQVFKVCIGEGATGVRTDTDTSARIQCLEATQVQVSWREEPEEVEEILRRAQETHPLYFVEADPRDPGLLRAFVDVQANSLALREIAQLGQKIFSDVRSGNTAEGVAQREEVRVTPVSLLWKKIWFQTHMNCVAKAIEDCKQDDKNFQLIGVTPEIVNEYTRQEVPALFEFIWESWQKNYRPFGDDKEFHYRNVTVKSIPLGSLERELGRIIQDGDIPIIMSCSEDMHDTALGHSEQNEYVAKSSEVGSFPTR